MEKKNNPKILIVDDLVSLQKSISQALRGYDLTIAGGFDEASKVIENNIFDLAIIDVRLEYENIWNVDGLYLLKQIKEKNKKCGVIIFTGHRESIRDESLEEYESVIILEKDETVNIKLLRDIVMKLLVTR
jgi:DNA-binding NtrC family response regulator